MSSTTDTSAVNEFILENPELEKIIKSAIDSSAKKALNTANLRKALREFPQDGNARVQECADFLGFGRTTFLGFVKDGRIKSPTRFGNVVAWSCAYVRELAETGIPAKEKGEV